jgi:DNA segregation ATPase FtsK/SpoIIIE, S-DNA-T family
MLKEWYRKQQAKSFLMKVFKDGEIGISYSYGQNKGMVYPKIHSVKPNKKNKNVVYTFSIPTGLDPKEVKKKEYCFKQVFGDNIELKGDVKLFTLTIYLSVLPDVLHYSYKEYAKGLIDLSLPIIAGIDINRNIITYDMVKYPHLLIAGETGSGKSTQLRSILTTLIQTLDPNRLQLFLCDLKRSEFHIFRYIEHVQGLFVSPNEIMPMLTYLKKVMEERGDSLDHHEVAHVDDLPNKPPYIVVCIDEVALLKKEKKLMDIVEEISAIGRALGVFLILSMQRPDRDVLDGKLKNNLTVRMGFRCADLINSRIIGTPGSEKIKDDGRMLLKSPVYRELLEVQAPYVELEGAKKILEGYKSPKRKKPNFGQHEANKDIIDMEQDIFEVLD